MAEFRQNFIGSCLTNLDEPADDWNPPTKADERKPCKAIYSKQRHLPQWLRRTYKLPPTLELLKSFKSKFWFEIQLSGVSLYFPLNVPNVGKNRNLRNLVFYESVTLELYSRSNRLASHVSDLVKCNSAYFETRLSLFTGKQWKPATPFYSRAQWFFVRLRPQ